MQYVGYRLFNKIRNCGDAINPFVIEHVTGIKSAVVSGANPNVVGIGSIFFKVNENSYLWGTGVINDARNIPKLDQRKIRALRGKKTADYLIKAGFKLPNIPFGDGGIFASDLIDYRAVQNKRFKVGVVPHYASIDHPFFKNLKSREDVCIIDMMDDTLRPVQQIAQCDVVLSQSLHGLVFAESLGIPNLWISENDSPDWNFKFLDWFTTTRTPQNAPWTLDKDFDDMVSSASLHDSLISKFDLRSVFPVQETSFSSDLIEHRECLDKSPLRLVSDLYPDAAAVDLDKIDGGEIENLKRLISKAKNSASRAYAYPTYAEIGRCINTNQEFLDEIARLLDLKRKYEIASIVRMRDFVNLGCEYKLKRWGSVSYFEGRILGSSIVIRPSGSVGLDDPFLVVVV